MFDLTTVENYMSVKSSDLTVTTGGYEREHDRGRQIDALDGTLPRYATALGPDSRSGDSRSAAANQGGLLVGRSPQGGL